MVGAMIDAEFAAVCRALGLEPWQAIPRRSQAWINAEREWREIFSPRPFVIERRRRRDMSPKPRFIDMRRPTCRHEQHVGAA